jgi:hypothetical protein
MGGLRRWVLVLVAIAAAAPIYGFASSLGTASRRLGTNAAPVSRCDSDGVTIVQNLSGNNVASVTVGSIASACATGAISVNVNNGSANSSGTNTVPAGGGSVTVTLATAVAATQAETIQLTISGP